MGAASRGIALAAPTAMAAPAAAAASGSETFKGTIVICRVSGTRTVITFAAAPGRFTGQAVPARNPDDCCSSAQDPLHAVDMITITATGTLSF